MTRHYSNGVEFTPGAGSLYYRQRACLSQGWARQADQKRRVDALLEKAADLEANGEHYLAGCTMDKALEIDAE